MDKHDEHELRAKEDKPKPVKGRQIFIDPGENDRGATAIYETPSPGTYVVERRATAAGKWTSTEVLGEPHMEPKDILALAPEAAPEALERLEEMEAEAAVHTTKSADVEKQEPVSRRRVAKRG
jgi:hypothetical protein